LKRKPANRKAKKASGKKSKPKRPSSTTSPVKYNRCKLRCSDCTLSFDTVAKLDQHRKQAHGVQFDIGEAVVCPDCGVLVSAARIAKHRRRVHLNVSEKQ
jgi:hypothetical protein